MDNNELFIALKEMFDKKIEESKQHTGVIVENLKSDIKAIAEGHLDLNRKMDNMQQGMDNMQRGMGNIQNDLNMMKQDMGLVKNYIIGVDEKLNEHEMILKRVK
ncbi:MAG: hypothetical protein RBT41_08230 [Clostridia bacterium]|jgi:hypothetical protein|nr:hypothetical protein [Clostridia bacterium]